MKGFTILEVLIAVLLLGLAFGTFAVSAGRLVDASLSASEVAVACVVAGNAVSEVLELGKAYTGKEVSLMGVSLKVEQDFEDFMGFRIVTLRVSSSLTGRGVELYEAR